MEVEEFLEHHGVKGMKWGIRVFKGGKKSKNYYNKSGKSGRDFKFKEKRYKAVTKKGQVFSKQFFGKFGHLNYNSIVVAGFVR